jgi:hypothetical protein
MSTMAVVLPFVWATEMLRAVPKSQSSMPQQPVPPEMAFYRKYTEGMLRRYLRLSMEAGKVPSLLGQEMFRGNVTSCRVDGFDDVVMTDLGVLKSQMEQVMGIGQIGRLAQLEDRMREHEKAVQRMKGVIGAFGGLLTIIHLAIDFFVGKH